MVNDKKKLKNKECKFEVNVNELGMVIISCKTHGDIDSLYERAKFTCYFKFINKFERIIEKEK